jgi:hypothetical protein
MESRVLMFVCGFEQTDLAFEFARATVFVLAIALIDSIRATIDLVTIPYSGR